MKENKKMMSKETITTRIQKLQRRKANLKERGITLIALVVTIIILLILAGVTLNIALGQNGLISRTQNVVERYKKAQEDEELEISQLENMLEKQLGTSGNGESPSNPGGPIEPPTPPEEKEPTTVQDAKSKEYKFEETTTVTDKQGNPVVIPGEFKIAKESGETVQGGIVIEDDEGNQFVWIPVSNVDGDNNEKTEPDADDLIVLDDNTKVEITLGRYTFDPTNGNPTLIQKGTEYTGTKNIKSYFQETSNHPKGGTSAKNLKAFVESVKENHGYYFARYEASFGSGNSLDNYKPIVKKSTSNSTSSMTYNESETLWNFITQGDASTVSKNMYKTNVDDEAKYVESDLINSYAWDTAIVYIQKMGNNNYANQKRGTNTSLMNTGETGDEKCHICDIADNLLEWATEYCTFGYTSGLWYPCVGRGGVYNNDYNANDRNYFPPTYTNNAVGFRPLLYIK